MKDGATLNIDIDIYIYILIQKYDQLFIKFYFSHPPIFLKYQLVFDRILQTFIST